MVIKLVRTNPSAGKSPFSQSVSFCDQTFANLIFLPLIINGIELTALFDTGAGMSFISQSIADQLGALQVQSTVTGGNNQGLKNAYQTILAEQVQIGTMMRQAQIIGILPDEALNFGEDAGHNPFPASMLLGWDMISRFCWEFDMNKRLVQISPGGSMIKSNSLSWDSFPIFSINYEGFPYPVGFDSGHTDSFLDKTWMTKLRNLKASDTVIQGIGSASAEEIKIADEFSFTIDQTPVTLYQIEIAQHQIYGADHGQICGLLGADILHGTKWTIDYQSRYFSIRPARGML